MSEKEIIELVASIEAVKDFTKDFDVIFNFINEDDSKDKKIKEIVKLQLQHSKELCDELAIAKTSSFEKEDKHTGKEENKIMEKNSIDKCVNIARNLNNMNDEEILLVYDMLLDQQRTALETSLFYQIYENKHKELKKLEARKIIDSYISDYYDQHHHESIYKYLMTRINEENME